jgi:hypothetical protein
MKLGGLIQNLTVLKKKQMKLVVLSILCLTAFAARSANLGEPLVFTGTCDASAASALSDDLFVVANDEDNLLRFYRVSRPGKPVQTFDLKSILPLKGKGELDLEGAARLGDKVFLISSHGRDADGKYAPNRHRLFALQLSENDGGISVQLAGKPYSNLLSELDGDPRYARFGLAQAAGLSPKSAGGFDIEALTDTANGSLLIGLRSPVPQSRALLIPLLNPNEVINGQAARFGEPLLLDLGGLGLRGVSSTEKDYYVLAGPAEGNASSRLYFWNGTPSAPQPLKEINFQKVNPEGICLLSGGERTEFLILSDDGSRKVRGKECKDLREADRQFRAYRFSP